MKHALLTLLIAGATAALPALAQTQASGSTSGSASASSSASSAASTTKATTKPAAKKATPKKVVKKVEAPVVADPEVDEPEVAGTTVTDYKCELGNNITIFQNNDDDSHIALKWGKRLHRMERVKTTTGAVRFENRYYGLVWIGIPSKGMLLDSKHGHQLANECKSPEQLAPQTIEAPKAPTTAPTTAPGNKVMQG